MNTTIRVTPKTKRARKAKLSQTELRIIFAVSIVGCLVFFGLFFFLGRASVRVPVIQIANQATGDWTRLDLSKYPRVSLFCGTPVGGYACSVNRVQPDMDKDAGTGILLVPYVNESVPDTPPAGSGHAPDSQKQREHSDSFETRKLRAAR